MSGKTNSAYCTPGDHFVPRGTATAYRQGDFAGLVCPEHVHLVAPAATLRIEPEGK